MSLCLHRLSTVMAIVALACLSGVGQGYRSVSRFAKRLTKLQRRALQCWIHPDTAKSKVPSEAVFQRVLEKVPRLQVEQIREDQSRVRQPNAASVLGTFRRLSNAFKHVWAKGRPKRQATSADWIEENLSNRWRGIHLITRPVIP